MHMQAQASGHRGKIVNQSLKAVTGVASRPSALDLTV